MPPASPRRRRYGGEVDARADAGWGEDGPPELAPAALGDEPTRHNALPSWLESWRRRSATGAVLTGIAFGVREALEPERDNPPIVAPAPGAPPGPQPLELHLDEDRPEDAWAVVRPWLAKKPPAPPEGDDPAARNSS